MFFEVDFIIHYYGVILATLLLSNIQCICHIALTTYCTNYNLASCRSIAKDQRSCQSHRESIGLCKNLPMEHTASMALAETIEK